MQQVSRPSSNIHKPKFSPTIAKIAGEAISKKGPRPRARPLRFQKAAATFPPKIFLGGLRGLAGILMESNTF